MKKTIQELFNKRLNLLDKTYADFEHDLDNLETRRNQLNNELFELGTLEKIIEQDMFRVSAQKEILELTSEEFESISITKAHLDFIHNEIGKSLETWKKQTPCEHDCKCCDHFPDPPIAPTSCVDCKHTYESACPGKTSTCAQFEYASEESEYKTICDTCRLAYTGDCSDIDLGVSDCIHYVSTEETFEDEDSAILTAEDLANTIPEEAKPRSLIFAQLALFSEDDVENAICSAIGEYAASCPQSHFSRFYVRAFIDHLESALGNNCDISYDVAVSALEMSKSVKKVYEHVWERLN